MKELNLSETMLISGSGTMSGLNRVITDISGALVGYGVTYHIVKASSSYSLTWRSEEGLLTWMPSLMSFAGAWLGFKIADEWVTEHRAS